VSSERKKTEEKDRQVVVSVRFPSQLLERIHAVAAIESVTANAIIREGMDSYIREHVASPGFQEARTAYLARAEAQVATALQDHSA
jgi:predicted DNA-binding protein